MYPNGQGGLPQHARVPRGRSSNRRLEPGETCGNRGHPQKNPVETYAHALQDGTEVKNRADRDRVWLTHFGEQECREVVKIEGLLHRPAEPLIIDEQLSWDHTHLPSLGEIEYVLRQAPCRRATGLDAIPGELLRASPGVMSRILQPLMVKAAACLQQPLQWRGGLLYEAFKNAGSHRDPSSYRSLYVASVVGKAFTK